MVDFTENFSQYAISKLPTFRDDFTSYSTQGEADIAWASADVSKNRVNIATDVLDFNIVRDNTNDSIVHDLGSTISDSNWVLRFKLTIDTLNQTALQTQGFFGLFDGNETEGEEEPFQNSIGVVLTAITGSLTYRLFTSEESTITSGQSTIFAHALAVETVYVEIKRNSETTYEVNLYSDAKYSILIESQQGISTAGTIGLRYIGMKNNASMTLGSSILGSMDDVEFWDEAQQGDVIFQDDFSGADNWDDAHASSGVNTTTDVIDFTFSTTNQNESMVYDLEKILGVGNFADPDHWVLRFKFNLTSTTPSTANLFYVGLNNTSETSGSTIAQHGVNIAILDATLGVKGYRLYDWDNEIPNAIGHDAQELSNPFVLSTDYFVELKRTSVTTYECQVFTDADFIIPFGAKLTGTLATTAGLRYIKIVNPDTVTATNMTGIIDDVEFYDGVLVTKTPIKERIDFEDNFEVNNWTQTGTKIVVNTSTQVVDCDWLRNAFQHDVAFDLETVLDDVVNPNRWGLRFKLKVITAVTGNNDPRAMVWLTEQAGGGSGISFQDHASFIIRHDDATGDLIVSGVIDDFTGIITGTSIIVGTNLFGIGDTIYCEMIRNKNFWTISVYSDPDFTQLLGTGSIDEDGVSTVADLRYLKIGQFVSSINVGGAFTGTVDKIQFWNGNNPTEHGTKWVEIDL